MKISARNLLKGKIVEVTKRATTAHVKNRLSTTCGWCPARTPMPSSSRPM
jgi:hypothetical protein